MPMSLYDYWTGAKEDAPPRPSRSSPEGEKPSKKREGESESDYRIRLEKEAAESVKVPAGGSNEATGGTDEVTGTTADMAMSAEAVQRMLDSQQKNMEDMFSRLLSTVQTNQTSLQGQVSKDRLSSTDQAEGKKARPDRCDWTTSPSSTKIQL